MAELNARHAVPGLPPPVYYYKTALKLPSLVALYRLAHFCIVSSLHDGMNLVAKEFVAARDDEDGVLVLSALAGAAQELREALVINPYDVDGFAARSARRSTCRLTNADAECARCGGSSPDAMSSAGRRTSWKGSRACGPSRCTMRRGHRKTRQCKHSVTHVILSD